MRKFIANNIELNLSKDVLDIFCQFKQLKRRSKESGGVLLGQVVGNKFYVTRVSTPNKFDKQSRHSFERNIEIAQIICDFEFVNSKGKTIYLGEWHTHPEPHPTPSIVDKKMIEDQYSKGKFLKKVIFMIIQGQKDLYVALYNGSSVIQMKEIK